jgi:hypothetical protein
MKGTAKKQDMKMNIKLLAVIGALGALSLSSFAFAQSGGGGGRPAEPPFAAMAKQLGVSEANVKACFPKPPSGGQSGGRPERPDMSAVASCLQNANASLSAAQVEKVLKDNAPQRGRK